MVALRRDSAAAESNFGQYLVSAGRIAAGDLMQARSEARRVNGSLAASLTSSGLLSGDELAIAQSAFNGLAFVALNESPPDDALCELFDTSLLLRYRVIPWRRAGGTVTFVISDSDNFTEFLNHVHLDADAVPFVFAAPSDIINWLTTHHRQALTRRAAARVPEAESCRTWERHTNTKRLALTTAGLSAFGVTVFLLPQLAFAIFAIWAIATLLISSVLRLTAYSAEISAEPNDAPPPCPTHALPRISVLVPLFKEREIAGALLQRLARLSYPKSLLDIVLVVEENDRLTKDTIAAADLPPWITCVDVPEGAPKTKPRAMNYALDFCRGDIIGIWDAEDAPASDQLEIVARYFHSAPEDVVCLQGVLDYYNSRQNWLARCFTIEYAAWFRLILPGMARLGFAIPLGGTTLFFRRKPLEELGGWDAHNVTEDADLGFRLARHGYRTEVIPTRTGEEANCKAWPWIKQRSRWLKGYMVTYLVHMRAPKLLLKQLGPWRFLGFQVHFVTALSQVILAPVLWSFWLVLFGFAHPLETFISRDLLMALGLAFLAIELINALINATASARPGLRHLFVWVPTMHFYYPLGAIAAYKALYELVIKPYYWDKTQHGLSLGHLNKRQGAHATSGPGVKLQPGHESL